MVKPASHPGPPMSLRRAQLRCQRGMLSVMADFGQTDFGQKISVSVCGQFSPTRQAWRPGPKPQAITPKPRAPSPEPPSAL